MKIKALTGFFLFLHLITFAQNKLDTLPHLDLTKIALVNQDGYITFPNDISVIRFGIMTEILRF